MPNYTTESLEKMQHQAASMMKEFKKLKKSLMKEKSKNLDLRIHPLHDDEFEKIDCLACANCCSTISPILYQRDIERAAKQLKLKTSDFIDTYLYIDEDNDYVFQQTPCPFLGEDKYCAIYESRPRACREYPHTDRKNIGQIIDKTFKNAFVCPAVFNIFNSLRK